jgi:hypothetical protein
MAKDAWRGGVTIIGSASIIVGRDKIQHLSSHQIDGVFAPIRNVSRSSWWSAAGCWQVVSRLCRLGDSTDRAKLCSHPLADFQTLIHFG